MSKKVRTSFTWVASGHHNANDAGELTIHTSDVLTSDPLDLTSFCDHFIFWAQTIASAGFGSPASITIRPYLCSADGTIVETTQSLDSFVCSSIQLLTRNFYKQPSIGASGAPGALHLYNTPGLVVTCTSSGATDCVVRAGVITHQARGRRTNYKKVVIPVMWGGLQTATLTGTMQYSDPVDISECKGNWMLQLQTIGSALHNNTDTVVEIKVCDKNGNYLESATNMITDLAAPTSAGLTANLYKQPMVTSSAPNALFVGTADGLVIGAKSGDAAKTVAFRAWVLTGMD